MTLNRSEDLRTYSTKSNQSADLSAEWRTGGKALRSRLALEPIEQLSHFQLFFLLQN